LKRNRSFLSQALDHMRIPSDLEIWENLEKAL